jgi:DNA-binding MarR family transcriptional regulator
MQRFNYALIRLREAVGSDFTTQQAMILVALWLKPEQSQTELAKTLNLKICAAGRHCRSLSEFTRPAGETDFEVKGQRLIEGNRDPRRANTMRYRLAEKAKLLMDQFATDLAGA